MSFKTTIENSPVVIISTFVIGAFVSGVMAMKFISENNREPGDVGNKFIEQKILEKDTNINFMLEQLKISMKDKLQCEAQLGLQKGTVTQSEVDAGLDKGNKIIMGISPKDIETNGIFGGPNSFFRKPFG